MYHGNVMYMLRTQPSRGFDKFCPSRLFNHRGFYQHHFNFLQLQKLHSVLAFESLSYFAFISPPLRPWELLVIPYLTAYLISMGNNMLLTISLVF